MLISGYLLNAACLYLLYTQPYKKAAWDIYPSVAEERPSPT